MMIFAEKMQMSVYLKNQQMVQVWLAFYAKKGHKMLRKLTKVLF